MYRKQVEFAGLGVIFGAAGLILARIARESPDLRTLSMAFVSAALTSLVIWRIAVENTQWSSWWGAGLIGACVSWLSHPVFHYMMFASSWVLQHLGLERIGPGGPAVDPLNALWGCLLYSLFSWIVFGIPTLLLGSGAGVCAHFWRFLLTRGKRP